MLNLILVIGIMLSVGLLGGLATQKVKFPRITGYVLIGLLLSPSLFHLLERTSIDSLDIVTDVSLGIIAYLIGSSLRLDSIRKLGKSILWITPLQSLVAGLLIFIAIIFLAPFIIDSPSATFANTYLPMALVLGAIAMTTAPAITMASIRECKAKGPMTTTLHAVVALDDVIAVLGFSIALGFAQPLVTGVSGVSWHETLAIPCINLGMSASIGIGLGFCLVFLIRLVKTQALLLVAVLGIIVLGVGLANQLGISLILLSTMVGFVVTNRIRNLEPITVIENIEDLIYNLYFVSSGMFFNANVMGTAGILALIYFGVRFAGKYLGTNLGARVSGAPEAVRKYLGLALIPQAGVALGLALLARRMFPVFGETIFNLVLASAILNEIVSPPLARYAISKAGESNMASAMPTSS